MQDIYLPSKTDMPEVDFQFSRHYLALRGESYAESVTAFYGPITSALMRYLERTVSQEISVDFALCYVNTCSTKILRSLFRMLDEASSNHNVVHINWHHAPDDKLLRDIGRDLAQDLITLKYKPVATLPAYASV